jgi:hypothetical protein
VAELRFGVSSAEGKVSPYFKVRTSARGDIYAVSEVVHQFLHISLHESLDHWHARIESSVASGKFPVVPEEVAPGRLRATTLFVPGVAARLPKTKKKVQWIPRNEGDPQLGVRFYSFVQRQEGGAILDWPHQGVEGISLIGRLRLGHFGTLTVTAIQEPMAVTHLEVDAPGTDRVSARQALESDFAVDGAFVLLALTPKDGPTEFVTAPGSMFRIVEEGRRGKAVYP